MHLGFSLVRAFIDRWIESIVSMVMAVDVTPHDRSQRESGMFTGLRPMYAGMQCAALAGILIMLWYVGRPQYVLYFHPDPQELVILLNQTSEVNYFQENPKNFAYEVLKRPVWHPPPNGSTMPPRKAFALQKDMVAFRAKKNVIVMTFGNYAFMDFILTWTKGLTDVGVTNFLIGAMDDKILEALFWKGVPVFDLQSGTPTQDLGWGTTAFHKLGREKIYLLQKVLELGFELLLCDSDAMPLKNPLPYFERYPHADILCSTDLLVPTVEDDSLEHWESAIHAALNIGYFLWRPSTSAKKLLNQMIKDLRSDPTKWDQGVFNDLIHKRLGPGAGNSTGLFYAYDGSLKVGILPASIFGSGHTYFVQGLYKQLGLKPYVAHTTFQFSGTEGKRHRLREACIFDDPPSYYKTPGGFISFDPAIPPQLLTGARTLNSHFALVNYQLVQIRDALAIATVLNRTLVMPPLWCRYDRFWFLHEGIIPGTRLPDAFLCPMDHIFEVDKFLNSDMPEDTFGPEIKIREYSFLENPRLPNEVKTSHLRIEVCNETTCNSSAASSILLQRNLTSDKLLLELARHNGTMVLEFSSIRGVFGGFTEKEVEAKFEKRVKRYTSIWCCGEAEIGHIYYDIFWDRKANWTPKYPSNSNEDHPPW